MAKLEHTQLHAIAHSLGLPLEAFFAEAPQGGMSEAVDLIQLWSNIGDAQGRRRVLSVARQEAERFGVCARKDSLSVGCPAGDAPPDL